MAKLSDGHIQLCWDTALRVGACCISESKGANDVVGAPANPNHDVRSDVRVQSREGEGFFDLRASEVEFLLHGDDGVTQRSVSVMASLVRIEVRSAAIDRNKSREDAGTELGVHSKLRTLLSECAYLSKFDVGRVVLFDVNCTGGRSGLEQGMQIGPRDKRVASNIVEGSEPCDFAQSWTVQYAGRHDGGSKTLRRASEGSRNGLH
jgi:hypothetical protein